MTTPSKPHPPDSAPPKKPMLLPLSKFYAKIFRSLLLGVIMTAIALGIGMFGYHHTEKMSWIDAFANASMILSGMGPLSPLNTNEGKIFAGCYALFSGLAFIVIIAVILGPVARRCYHKMHIDIDSR